MQAMILAAGLGTRLRPWTLTHPKALVPVGGVPMLERVIERLRNEGFVRIVVNVHHFSDQVTAFLGSKDFGVEILVSDESPRLLDTGGAILAASGLFREEDGPVLVHNVDILSNADLRGLVAHHLASGADSTLLVSDRDSGRKLVFDREMVLRGWHNLKDGVYRPESFVTLPDYMEYAFSGIHVVGEGMISEMRRIEHDAKFAVMDFLLSDRNKCQIKGCFQPELRMIDIGKPDTLLRSDEFV